MRRRHPGALLDEPFREKELRELHEVVAGVPLMRNTFRRFMEPEAGLDRADV